MNSSLALNIHLFWSHDFYTAAIGYLWTKSNNSEFKSTWEISI